MSIIQLKNFENNIYNYISNDLDNYVTTSTLTSALASLGGSSTIGPITPATIGLGNVDNTSDVNKPVSLATQRALDAKASLAGATFTGTVNGISKATVGLGNADNTSDLNKPIATAVQTALDAKASLAGATFAGTVNGISKAMVGLGNVDNTSDLNKPVSTAVQNALSNKQNNLTPIGDDTTTNGIRLLNGTSVRAVKAGANTIMDSSNNIITIGTVSNPTFSSITLGSSDLSATLQNLSDTASNTFAPKLNPTFTGTLTAPTIILNNSDLATTLSISKTP